MRADVVAQAGYEALMKGTSIVIPGFRNKLAAVLSRFSPRSIVLRVVNKLNSSE